MSIRYLDSSSTLGVLTRGIGGLQTWELCPQNNAKKISSMPHLTEVALRAIKPSGKVERFYDQQGLYLELSKAGGKLWRWKYRYDGKEKRLSFGAWPDVSLKEAREKRDEARSVLRKGVDPGAGNRKRSSPLPAGRTFESVAREWVNARLPVWS